MCTGGSLGESQRVTGAYWENAPNNGKCGQVGETGLRSAELVTEEAVNKETFEPWGTKKLSSLGGWKDPGMSCNGTVVEGKLKTGGRGRWGLLQGK